MKLMIMLTEVMPFETMIESLADDCLTYKMAPTEELKSKIIMGAHMVCLKEAINQEGGVEALDKRIEDLKKADEFFKPNLS